MVLRYPDDLDVPQAALRGAVAGLAGGVSILLLSWLVRRGVVSTEDTVDAEWDRLVKRAARTAGMKLNARQVRVARMTAQLIYSALVGSVYGVVRTRRALPGPLRAALNSGLVHAASVPVVAQATAAQAPKRRKKRTLRGVAIPVGSAALYGLTTSAAFTALERA